MLRFYCFKQKHSGIRCSPYFKEHYSRYYHVLNTLCLYDYPALPINPQTHELSIGRNREDRRGSDFGKKAKALGAFETLITKCATAGVVND